MTAALGFAALMIAFWFVGRHFGVADKLGGHLPSAILSFALLLGPFWAFGFGAGEWLRKTVQSAAVRALIPGLLIIPYVVFTLPRGQFRWSMCLAILGVVAAALGDLDSRSIVPTRLARRLGTGHHSAGC